MLSTTKASKHQQKISLCGRLSLKNWEVFLILIMYIFYDAESTYAEKAEIFRKFLRLRKEKISKIKDSDCPSINSQEQE